MQLHDAQAMRCSDIKQRRISITLFDCLNIDCSREIF